MRRSKLDLVLGVLRAVKSGTDKPTRIMYTVNLSWKPTQTILNSLVGQGLLSLIEEEGQVDGSDTPGLSALVAGLPPRSRFPCARFLDSWKSG